MKKTCLVLSICTLTIGVAFLSAAWGYSTTASTLFHYMNSTYNNRVPGTPASSAGAIVPGASGAGSSIDGSYTGSSSYSISAADVQDYGIFYARASAWAKVPGPGKTFEVWQVFASGTFIETLTISAPIGVTNGSLGRLTLGWNVTGSSVSGPGGDAHLAMFAQTSASLPQTSSNTVSITRNGHYALVSPISFTFGTPFELTVRSELFAAVGYDYTNTSPPPINFDDAAAADFLHTAILSTAAVSDGAGTPLFNFTITTDSGRAFPIVITYSLYLPLILKN